MPNPKSQAKALARKAVPPAMRRRVGRAAKELVGARQKANEPYALWRAQLNQRLELSTPVRAAFVGAGTQARSLASALTDAGGTVTAAADLRPGVAESFVADFAEEGSAHETVESCLATLDGSEVVVVATTAASHAEIALEAMEAGARKLVIEKPLATSVEDALAIEAAAQACGAAIAVNHSRRWLPSSHGVARLVRSGAIGRPRALNFMWGRNGFAMIGTHLFDFARLLTEEDVSEVSCRLDPDLRVTWRGAEFVDQPGTATALMTDGTRISIDLSTDLPTQQGFLVIVGETGRIEVDEMLGKVRMVGTGRRVWETPYGFDGCLPLAGATAIADLHEGRAPACSVADGRAALEAVVACQISSAAGGTATALPLADAEAAVRYPFA